MKARHIDESSNRTKQQLYGQSIHARVNITKIRNFLRSFSVKIFNQGSLTFLVQVKTNLKFFKVGLLKQIEKTR